MERHSDPRYETQEGDRRKRRMDAKLGRSQSGGRRHRRQRRIEERGRLGEGRSDEERGREERRRAQRGRERRQEKEKEKEGRKVGQSGRWPEEFGADLRGHGLRPGPSQEEGLNQEGQEDPEAFQEETKEEFEQRDFLEQVFFDLQQQCNGGYRTFRRTEGDAQDLETGPWSIESWDSAGGPANPSDSSWGAAGSVEGPGSPDHGAVLSREPSTCDGPCALPGEPPLVDAHRPAFAGAGCPRSGLGLPETQELRKLCSRGHHRHSEESGVGAGRQAVAHYTDRGHSGRKTGDGGEQVELEDTLPGEGRRKRPTLWPGKREQEQERRKERQRRRKAAPEGERGREGESAWRSVSEGVRKRKGAAEDELPEQGIGDSKERRLKQARKMEEEGGALSGGASSRESGECFTEALKGAQEVTATGSRVEAVNVGGATCLPEGSCRATGIRSFASFSGLLTWAWDVLKTLRSHLRMQLTTAKDEVTLSKSKDDIFPLPTSQALPEQVNSVVAALNDFSGHEPIAGDDDTSDSSWVVQKTLRHLVERFDMWDSPCPQVSFKQLFTTKTLDYSGEEIKVAQRLNWKCVAPSLPDGVGQLPLEDFCRLGTLHYVQHFTEYLVPEDTMQVPKPPTVMVEPGSWDDLCRGLVDRNICEIWAVDELFHFGGKPLLNGLFAVGKGEFDNGREIQRLIMNLTPLNSLCRSLGGDVSTLPGLSGFSGFLLERNEVALLSSEDIRCFFYLFSIPADWKPFMGFSREISEDLKPPDLKGRACVLVSRVLPMGFINSVSIAQHVHRNIVRWSGRSLDPPVGREGELRKDLGMSSSKSLYRVYLDNFDQVERCDRRLAEIIKGTPSAQVLQLRHDYQLMGLPRHPKKAVQRQFKAEIQGAMFDGLEGYAMPKAAKVWQYALLGAELLQRKQASLKELQVVCGGFVYIAMFRRPLLGSLNEVWAFMQTFKGMSGVKRIPAQVQSEIARFIMLMPLAQMDFRADLCDQVTCSDASTLGGGICVSEGLTGYGVSAANSRVRGDVPEMHDMVQVLTVGLFDGVGALRVAADSLGLPIAGHVSVEMDAKGRRVVESWFPGSKLYQDVREFGEEQVQELAMEFSNVGLVIIGAGPPCQGVSKLNADRKGALRDSRSSLFQEVPRIEALFRKRFYWAQVHRLMESVASMNEDDRRIMSQGVGGLPYKIDAWGLTLCHRPRLYWPTWELVSEPGATVEAAPGNDWGSFGQVVFTASLEPEAFLERGWTLADDKGLPTFTASQPKKAPGRRPAGLDSCHRHEKLRWELDRFRFPPYQYRDLAGLVNKKGDWRQASIAEREALKGFPVGYTSPCVPKGMQKGVDFEDSRLTLIGNSWQVGVIMWLLYQLCRPLGLCDQFSVEQIIQSLTPGKGSQLQTLLLRPPLHRAGVVKRTSSRELTKKLLGIVSVKGEDLLLQADTEMTVKHHRLRTSIPARLWKWRTVAGWSWRSQTDHINVLELRAILTSIRWWVKKKRCTSSRFLHLTDSLVCLHSLCRGRTSSKKMRRTLIRINALLLATDLHPLWGYVHTKENPADRPSRRPYRRKWGR